jgi:hypothetical protein
VRNRLQQSRSQPRPPTLPLGGIRAYPRQALPKTQDRLPLGISGLTVSPFALGITTSDTVLAAYDLGINFFFLTADFHWPLYQGLREGLEKLFERRPSVRDDVVVGVVSYLEQPMFDALAFHEVVDAVRGLRRVDLLIAGGVSTEKSLYGRSTKICDARVHGNRDARAIGASFHHRPSALLSINHNLLDIHFIRYNSVHPGAAAEIFPHIRPDRTGLIYNFKSMMSRVRPEQFARLGLSERNWRPAPSDYYRYVLTAPALDGVLCSPQSPQEVCELAMAMERGPLSPEQEDYVRGLSSAINPRTEVNRMSGFQ